MCSVYIEQDLIFKLSIDVPEIEKNGATTETSKCKGLKIEAQPTPREHTKIFLSNVETETKVTLRAHAAVLSM